MSLMVMKHYPKQFKDDAVALVLSDPSRTMTSVAKDLGISRETLRVWVRAAEAGGGGRRAGSAARTGHSTGDVAFDDVLAEENKKLKARIKELETERDILRKAAKFSRARRTGEPLPVR
jgi:transposase